jgi:hypothetical protein
MTNKLLLFVILLSLSIPVFSQDAEQDSTGVYPPKEKKAHRGFLGIAAGPSFPVGSFGSSNWENNNSGFGNTGYNFTGIDFGFKFVPAFGLAVSFKGANIPLDVQSIANFYATEYGGEFTVKSTRWNYGGVYLGPIVTIPTAFIDIDFRFMTGLMLAFTPEMEITRGQEFVKQSAGVGPSISVALGSGLRFHVSKSLSLTAGVEYLLARPVFEVEYSSNSSFESELVYQNITVLNTSIGLAFRIF